MKIIHISDLHIGQRLYMQYNRSEEMAHFFSQLTVLCQKERPDALLVSGDVFHSSTLSAQVRNEFNNYFVDLHHACPAMPVVIISGNHDSASHLQAESRIWRLGNVTLVGEAPSPNAESLDVNRYMVRLETGYIVTMPFHNGSRIDVLNKIFDAISAENSDNKPVVLMSHLAVEGMDATGHDEIGMIQTVGQDQLGSGYDYAALGHIHKPQTIGHREDDNNYDVTYQTPVVRYSGSALHVSSDEAYPHTISIVEIDRHGGNVRIRQERINELLHFYTLPEDGSSFTDQNDVEEAVRNFAASRDGYFRLRIDSSLNLAPEFDSKVRDIIENCSHDVRYNPRIVWTGEVVENSIIADADNVIDLADIQQIQNPMDLLTRIYGEDSDFFGLTMDEVKNMMAEVMAYNGEIDESAESENDDTNVESNKNL